MKAKLKFDMDQVKEFGKEHGEKFVLAGAVLLLGLFSVKAITRPTLPDNLEPQNIVAQSHKADQSINAAAVPPPAQEVQNINLTQVGNDLGFGPKGIDIRELIEEPFKDPVKRADPTMLPVEELRVAQFHGGLTVSPQIGALRGNPVPNQVLPAGGLLPGRAPAARPGGARRPVGGGLLAPVAAAAAPATLPFPPDFRQPGPQSTGFADGCYGIVVTGLIPEQAQREEFARRFKNARRGVMVENPNGASRGGARSEFDADSPHYVWCFLERTDTTEGKTTLLDFGDTQQVGQDRSQPDKKLSDETRAQVTELGLHPSIRKALEVKMHDWGIRAAEVVDKNYLSEPWFSWPLPPILLRDWGAEAAHPPQVPLAAPVGMAAPLNGPEPANPGQPDDAFKDAGATGPGAMMRQRGRMRGPIVGPMGGGMPQDTEVPYKLFRFVDLDVEPGHVYRYRVRMLLRNPNFGLEAQVLLNTDTANIAYEPTPWSEMSPAVAIPPDTRLLAGSIERAPRKEPKAQISVFTFDKVQAIDLIKEFDTELGDLVGTTVPDQIVKNVADPVIRQIHDMTGKFRTGSVLLDFRGNDEKLPGTSHSEGSAGGTVSLTDPAEMLLLENIDDPDHPRLIVVNEAKDKPIIDDWKKTHEAPVAPAAVIGPTPPGKAAPVGPTRAGGGLIPGGLLPPRTNNTQRRPTGR